MPEETLEARLEQVKKQIQNVALASNRNAAKILLLAVSKQQPQQIIQQAYQAGLRDFGENYFQEALPKIQALSHLPICWHFIGPIQSNKCKGIATYFQWVHSVDRLKIAQLLNTNRPKELSPLQVCIQIQLREEPKKSGITIQEAKNLAFEISKMPSLQLRGLMTIPPVLQEEKKQCALFLELNHLLHTLNKELDLQMDTLSMGMSQDMKPAIQAGSTILRVGQALFGKRI